MDQKRIMFYLIIRLWHLQMMNICLMMLLRMYNLVDKHYKKYILKNRSLVRHETRLEYLDSLIGSSDINCVDQLRMNKRTFGVLCELLRADGRVKKDGLVTLEEQVCMFLHTLSHHVKNRTIRSRFKRSGETISRYFNSVLHGVLRLQDNLLCVPEPVPADCTDDRWRWFKNCLGALDGTYIQVRVLENDKPRYRTRKSDIATNVLGVCSRDLKFIFVFPGWEGSASDSRVLRDAISNPNGLKVPRGCYYLVDAGYSNAEGFLSPYRGTRYHLKEWGQRIPSNCEEYFNMKHSCARNVIERCFGLLKVRWAILRSPSFYPLKTQCRIITACCLLHNLIRREIDVDPAECQFDNGAEVDETDRDDDIVNTIEASHEWTEYRNMLAMQMYNEWRQRRGL
ncbi:hypothetical protein UlMin_017904 [Ulmus minor]